MAWTTDSPAEQRRRIGAHRARLEARSFRLGLLLHITGRISQGREPIVSDATAVTTELDAATHRQLGVDLYNGTWTLLEKPDRSAVETDEMIHRAHASRWHWGRVGEEVNLARGEWLCSRVYAVLGRAEPALWHARRCVEIDEASPNREPWDLPSAYEAMARAHLVAGDRGASREWATKARAELAKLDDPDDREVVEGDLDSLDLD